MNNINYILIFVGVIFLAGVLLVLIMSVYKAGGFVEVWETSRTQGRLNFWNFNPDPYEDRLTFWSLVLGSIFAGSSIVVNQASVQRFCSLKTITQGKWSVILIAPAFFLTSTLTSFMGLAVFAYYDKKGCDPLKGKRIKNSNQLLTTFMLDELNYPGILGVFLSVMYTGALSTLSSAISALAAVTWKDVIEPYTPNLKENRKTLITKVLSAVYGVLAMACGLGFSYVEGHVMQMTASFVRGTAGPLGGMYFAGFFFPWVNAIGISVGALLGFAFTLWLAIGQAVTKPYPPFLPTTITNCTSVTMATNVTTMATNMATMTTAQPIKAKNVFILYRTSFGWFTCIGCVTTMVVALVVSFLTGPMKGSQIDPQLMYPIMDYILPCVPGRIRRKLWCGVKYDERNPSENVYEEGHLGASEEEKEQANGVLQTSKF